MNEYEKNANDTKVEEKETPEKQSQRVKKLLGRNRAAALGLAVLLAVGPLAAGCGRDEPEEEYQNAGQDMYQGEYQDDDPDFFHTKKSHKKVGGLGYVSYSGGS